MQNSFLREKHGQLYLVTRTGRGSKRKEKWLPLPETDRDLIEKTLLSKEALKEEIIQFPCMNPECRNTIPMTKSQLEDFFVSSKKKYDMIIMPFCSKECRDKMLEKHGGSIDEYKR
ncbi:MAG: hypothetical protein JXQ82_07735 [Methanomicrobiaceae archaeon]|nr:hypothetical protein [Methanomicrobiaceae archaeon]